MKEKLYEVSIIIPIYNVEKYIKPSLLSALSQDFKSIQYIIIDDCGTDKSMKIVSDVLAKSSRKEDVKIIRHKQNSGLSAARNTGIEHSCGEYIYFMDSDDEISKDCITIHYNKIKSTKADFTVANIKLIGARSIHIHPIPTDVDILPPITTYYRRNWSVSACNKMYSRELITRNHLRFVVGMIHEDYLWSYNIAKHAHKIAVINKGTYFYKIHPNSLTTKRYDDAKINSMLKVITTINKDIDEHNIEGKKFIDFIKLNAALYILNYHGRDSQTTKYNKVKSIRCKVKRDNIYSTILKLPYWMFFVLIKPIYYLYKNTK